MASRFAWIWKRMAEVSSRGGDRPESPKKRGSRCPQRRRLVVEGLEQREVLATFVVTNLADQGAGSLRDAVLAANAQAGADVIKFQKGLAGSIVLTSGEIALQGQLSIDGPGASRLTVSGNRASRVFSLDASATQVTIRNLRIADGRATTQDNVGILVTRGGGILNEGGNLLLDNVRMENNSAFNDRDSANPSRVVGGGAIVNSTGARLTVRRSTFRNNLASGGYGYSFGGAIANVTNSFLVIEKSDFRGNVARNGSVNYGGAVANFGSSSMTVSQAKMEDNQAIGLLQGEMAFGGAIAASRGTVNTQGSSTFLNETTVRRNKAQAGPGGDAGGGGIYNHDSTMTISRAKIEDNLAVGGDGDDAVDGGDAWGGGILNEQSEGSLVATLRMIAVEIAENLARGGRGREGGRALGGGIFNGPTLSTPTLQPSVQTQKTSIQENEAEGGESRVAGVDGAGIGGGIYTLGTFEVDKATQKALGRGSHANEASTEANNVYGTLTLTSSSQR